MSAELVKQSLEIVDSDFAKNKKGKKKKKSDSFISIFNNNNNSNKKNKKSDILLTNPTKKLTVIEAKNNYKSCEEKLKENLKKLELIKQSCSIQLDNSIASQIIKRGRTGKALKIKSKSKKKVKTAFTEEDFEKFEKEYMHE